MKNYGVILDNNTITGNAIGTISSIERVILQSNGDWSSYRPTAESQAYIYFDDYACVTHSTLLVIAAIFNLRIKKGLISDDNIEWLRDNGYFDDNGNINFNDRFTAKVSETICFRGNYQTKVNDAVKTFGLIPQSKWSYKNNEFESCPLFYADTPPDDAFELGVEFNKRFDLDCEYLNPNNSVEVNFALRYSPIVVLVRAWWKNSNGLYYFPVPPEVTYTTYNHQVVLYRPRNPETWIWDSYNDYDNTPFEKQLTPDYPLGTAYIWFMKELINRKIMSNVKKVRVKGSNARGFFVPSDVAESYRSDCKNYGKPCALDSDGNVDWSEEEKSMEGEVELF